MQFHDAAMMRRATIAGTGVGALSLPDAVEDTRAGLLVAPFGTDALAAMPADRVPGFYLVVLRARRRLQAVAAFCDRITGEDWSSDPQQCTEEACASGTMPLR
jgi:LysR family transcriptional regulator, glycine cleavage system transcriptional activator